MNTISRRKVKTGSILIAVLMNLHLINYAIVAITGAESGFSSIIYPAFFVIALLFWVHCGDFKIQYKWVLCLLVLFLWFWSNSSISRIQIAFLGAYILLPFFCICGLRYETEIVLFHTMLMGGVFIPGLPVLLNQTSKRIIGVDIAYSILPVIVAGIVHFTYYRKDLNTTKKIIYLIPLFYLYQLLSHGLRGPLACILATCIGVEFFKFDRQRNLQKKRFHIALTVFLFFCLFILIFITPLLTMLMEILQAFNINAYFITKTLRLLNSNDIMNGRFEIWSIAWNGFLEKPIVGHGFDSFHYYNESYPYVHNFLLQSLYDGGIIFFSMLCIIFINGVRNIIKENDRESISMFLFLSGTSIVYGLLTQDMFNIMYLWTLIGFLLIHVRIKVSQIFFI